MVTVCILVRIHVQYRIQCIAPDDRSARRRCISLHAQPDRCHNRSGRRLVHETTLATAVACRRDVVHVYDTLARYMQSSAEIACCIVYEIAAVQQHFPAACVDCHGTRIGSRCILFKRCRIDTCCCRISQVYCTACTSR